MTTADLRAGVVRGWCCSDCGREARSLILLLLGTGSEATAGRFDGTVVAVGLGVTGVVPCRKAE